MASALMIAAPPVEKIFDPWMLAPDFLIEIVVALWLTFGTLHWDVEDKPASLATSAETPQ